MVPTIKIRHLSTTTKLKLIALCMGMMFWYGIEQLFMNHVVHDPNIRALSTTVYTVTLLLFDIPGGIIADKFGRRKTIIIGAVLQVISVLVMGLSHSTMIFLIGVFAYGVYWALCNGAAQAMMYDHLLEEGRHKEYAKQQGSAYAFGYIGAGIANVLSGFMAHAWGFRTPYILSAIPAIIALLVALTLRETTRNVTAVRPSLFDYARQLFRTIKKSRQALLYAVQIIIGLIVFMTLCEFGQITLLHYGLSTIGLGIIWAIDAAAVAFALHHAHRLQKWPWQSALGYAAILATFAAFIPHAIVGTILFMVMYAGIEVVHNISETELQHATDAMGRATVLSSVSFVGNLLAIGAIWGFNQLLQSGGIMHANRVVAVLLAVTFCITASLIARSHASKL